MPEHERSNGNGFVFEHIVIAEEKYGRKIGVKEAVHHINGIKSDNRPENLIVFSSSGEHTAFHHTGSKRSRETGEKISKRAKERYKGPEQHPCYKAVDIQSMETEIRNGVTGKAVCAKHGINKTTYYKKLKTEAIACH